MEVNAWISNQLIYFSLPQSILIVLIHSFEHFYIQHGKYFYSVLKKQVVLVCGTILLFSLSRLK